MNRKAVSEIPDHPLLGADPERHTQATPCAASFRLSIYSKDQLSCTVNWRIVGPIYCMLVQRVLCEEVSRRTSHRHFLSPAIRSLLRYFSQCLPRMPIARFHVHALACSQTCQVSQARVFDGVCELGMIHPASSDLPDGETQRHSRTRTLSRLHHRRPPWAYYFVCTEYYETNWGSVV